MAKKRNKKFDIIGCKVLLLMLSSINNFLLQWSRKTLSKAVLENMRIVSPNIKTT